MEDLLEALLLDNGLSSQERQALREHMGENPELARAWAHWRQVRLYLRETLEERLSDRRLLVLYVLEEEGEHEALTPREQAALAEARDDIVDAIEALPALKRVVDRIREACVDFEETWSASEESSNYSPLADVEPAEAPRSKQPDRAPERPRSREKWPLRRYSRGLLTVAVVLAFVVTAVLFWQQTDDRRSITVSEGAIQTVRFAEGSSARLVGPAELTHPDTDDRTPPKHVTLHHGRAFFDVQPQQDRSFVVETPTATATVVGTRFGVKTALDTTEVVLASGTVEVGGRAKESEPAVVLEPGQKTWVSTDAVPAPPTSTDVIEELKWTGLFVFQSVPFQTIADRLSDEYGVEVRVPHELASEPVTGTFDRQQPVGEVLRALAAALGAEVEKPSENTYRLVEGA